MCSSDYFVQSVFKTSRQNLIGKRYGNQSDLVNVVRLVSRHLLDSFLPLRGLAHSSMELVRRESKFFYTLNILGEKRGPPRPS